MGKPPIARRLLGRLVQKSGRKGEKPHCGASRQGRRLVGHLGLRRRKGFHSIGPSRSLGSSFRVPIGIEPLRPDHGKGVIHGRKLGIALVVRENGCTKNKAVNGWSPSVKGPCRREGLRAGPWDPERS